jgi:sugar fermentation stimulation protein A
VVERGYRAAAVFVVQRSDAVGMRPHDESDPDFGRVLREVVGRGVEVYAYACSVVPGRVALTRSLPLYNIER